MPNRIIREQARTSPTLDQLSDGAERMFWRLTTVADDFGRFLADPRVLLSECFPLKVGQLPVREVAKRLDEMIACGLVTTYVVNGRTFGFFHTWERHNRKRARTSKYPAPPHAGTCQPMSADVLREARSETPRSEKRDSEKREARGGPTPPRVRIQYDPEAGGFTGIEPADLASWSAAFPGVDVEGEITESADYLRDHHAEYSDYSAFLRNRFKKARRSVASAIAQGTRRDARAPGISRPIEKVGDVLAGLVRP